jgi:hypothetical protein
MSNSNQPILEPIRNLKHWLVYISIYFHLTCKYPNLRFAHQEIKMKYSETRLNYLHFFKKYSKLNILMCAQIIKLLNPPRE